MIPSPHERRRDFHARLIKKRHNERPMTNVDLPLTDLYWRRLCHMGAPIRSTIVQLKDWSREE